MSHRHKHRRKRGKSIHQKQMRFWTIFGALAGIGLFTLAFYFINRWTNRTPG